MKQIIFLLSVLISATVFPQQVLNGDFENWTGSRPTGWDGSNETVLGVTFNTVVKVTDVPQSGEFAVKIQTDEKQIPFVGPVTMPGILTLGDFVLNVAQQTADINGGIAFAFRPVKLNGYFMSVPKTADSALIGLMFYKWNTSLNRRDTIGAGLTYFPDSITDWTSFETVIEWYTDEIPDSMNIIAASSDLFSGTFVNGSALWLDNLSFEYEVTGFENLQAKGSTDLTISPNPVDAKTALYFDCPENDNCSIRVYTMQGNLLFEERHSVVAGKNTIVISFENQPAGLYKVVVSGKHFRKSATCVNGLR